MGDYQHILNEIEDDIQETESNSVTDNRTIANDVNMVRTVQSQTRNETEYQLRDALYSELLDKYIDIYETNSNQKQKYKKVFFIVVLFMFIAIVVVSIIFMFLVITLDKSIAQIITVALGSFGSMLSAMIVLPKIIAKHLFPKDEESHILEMVKNMQINDSKIREYQKNQKL